jgi:hypothetical protein
VRIGDLDVIALLSLVLVAAGSSGAAAESGGFQVDVVRGGEVSRVVGTETGEITEVTMREDPRPIPQLKSSWPSDRKSESFNETRVYVIVNQVADRYPLYGHGFLPVHRSPRHHPNTPVRYRYRLSKPHHGIHPRGGRSLRF